MADDTQLFINNWSTTISDATVAVDAVTINIPAADSATLGAIAANEYYVATLSDGSNLEVVWIAANNESGALTVVRAKEDTSALSYTSGDTIEGRNTKGTYENFVQRDAAETLTQKTLTAPSITGAASAEGITLSKTLVTKLGSDVASANDMTLGDGNLFDITGVTTINTIVTKGIGTVITLQFDGILQLTHSADLFLPTATNITTAAGDIAVFYEYASGAWRCEVYTRADGTALVVGAPAAHKDTHTIQMMVQIHSIPQRRQRSPQWWPQGQVQVTRFPGRIMSMQSTTE